MIGTTIHGYTISKHLGTGGMAEVWYAENKLGKPASIKIMLKQFIGIDQVVLRFENEAKTMVQLQHPNIRQVYDYGEFEQQPFIIMEYLEGQDLSSFIKVKKAPSDEQLELWWQQCSSALNFTHSQGVIHRDIKPSNLFLDKNGDIKILDFGIAKVKQEITLTSTGQGLGTLLYMSPQQILDPKRVSPKCDFHSLAVSFVHIITGDSPYAKTESEFQLQSAIVNGVINLDGLPAKWKERLEGLVHGKNEKELNKGEGLAISQSHSSKQVYNDETRIDAKPISKSTDKSIEQPRKRKSILIFGVLGVVMLLGIIVGVLNSNGLLTTDGNPMGLESKPQWKIDYDEQFSLLLISESSRSAQQNKEAFVRLRNQLPEGDAAMDERKKVQEMIDLYENKIERELRRIQAERITNSMESDKQHLQENVPLTGTFIDPRDGKTYKWVKIGNQTWMAENLAFRPSSGNYWAYDNNPSNLMKYGYLYDWQTACNVCPTGWHLPGEIEWNVLISFLGGQNVAGYKMKSASGWEGLGNGSNESGFSGLPGGYRYYTSEFQNAGRIGLWWSSTSDDDYAFNRDLVFNNRGVRKGNENQNCAYSVRCVKN